MTVKNNKSFLKSITSLLGLLLIGAIGSGLWEIFLKDLLYNIGNIFVDGISFFYSDYVNSLYENVGKDGSVFAILPGLVLITLIIGFPLLVLTFLIFIYRKTIKKGDEINIEVKTPKLISYILKSRKALIAIAILMSIYNSITYTNLFIREVTTLRARNYIERTSEIIRPNMTEEEFLKLRSKYRQIDNKEKFENTLSQIISYAERDSIVLPEIKFYGINIKTEE